MNNNEQRTTNNEQRTMAENLVIVSGRTVGIVGGVFNKHCHFIFRADHLEEEFTTQKKKSSSKNDDESDEGISTALAATGHDSEADQFSENSEDRDFIIDDKEDMNTEKGIKIWEKVQKHASILGQSRLSRLSIKRLASVQEEESVRESEDSEDSDKIPDNLIFEEEIEDSEENANKSRNIPATILKKRKLEVAPKVEQLKTIDHEILIVRDNLSENITSPLLKFTLALRKSSEEKESFTLVYIKTCTLAENITKAVIKSGLMHTRYFEMSPPTKKKDIDKKLNSLMKFSFEGKYNQDDVISNESIIKSLKNEEYNCVIRNIFKTSDFFLFRNVFDNVKNLPENINICHLYGELKNESDFKTVLLKYEPRRIYWDWRMPSLSQKFKDIVLFSYLYWDCVLNRTKYGWSGLKKKVSDLSDGVKSLISFPGKLLGHVMPKPASESESYISIQEIEIYNAQKYIADNIQNVECKIYQIEDDSPNDIRQNIFWMTMCRNLLPQLVLICNKYRLNYFKELSPTQIGDLKGMIKNLRQGSCIWFDRANEIGLLEFCDILKKITEYSKKKIKLILSGSVISKRVGTDNIFTDLVYLGDPFLKLSEQIDIYDENNNKRFVFCSDFKDVEENINSKTLVNVFADYKICYSLKLVYGTEKYKWHSNWNNNEKPDVSNKSVIICDGLNKARIFDAIRLTSIESNAVFLVLSNPPDLGGDPDNNNNLDNPPDLCSDPENDNLDLHSNQNDDKNEIETCQDFDLKTRFKRLLEVTKDDFPKYNQFSAMLQGKSNETFNFFEK